MTQRTSLEFDVLRVQYKKLLSDSELELIKLLCLPSKVISERLGIPSDSIRMSVSRIGIKLGVENRTSIVVRALELRLITLQQLVYRYYETENTS